MATAVDVVLMDVRTFVLDGVRVAAILRDRLSAAKIILLTTFDEEVLRVPRISAAQPIAEAG